MKTVMEKIGFKAGMSGWAVNRPTTMADIFPLPSESPITEVDIIIAFVTSIREVQSVLTTIRPHYTRGKALWFAYPKKTGTIKTDITRDSGWQALHQTDLLPVTQIAIDETWSALRFRYRDEIKKMTRKSNAPTQKAKA